MELTLWQCSKCPLVWSGPYGWNPGTRDPRCPKCHRPAHKRLGAVEPPNAPDHFVPPLALRHRPRSAFNAFKHRLGLA